MVIRDKIATSQSVRAAVKPTGEAFRAISNKDSVPGTADLTLVADLLVCFSLIFGEGWKDSDQRMKDGKRDELDGFKFKARRRVTNVNKLRYIPVMPRVRTQRRHSS